MADPPPIWQQRLQHAVRVADVAALDRVFLDMVRSMRPRIITDVGSRDGEMAIACKRALPSAQVYAFEANPENFFEFAERVGREGVVFVPLAVGARAGTIRMHVPDWASARATASLQLRGIGSARPRAGVTGHVVYEAPAVELSRFFALPQHQDATYAHWIDVEGCSHEVLAGIDERLAARTLFLKIEVETQPFWEGQKLVGDCIDQCQAIGFAPAAWFDHREQFDIVFVNERLQP